MGDNPMSDAHLTVHEIECKSILNRSAISGIDYTINPYTGCMHGCVYCYARFMTRYTKHRMPWGRFADVKINAADVLKKQIAKTPKGLVSLSTVTDPYQALEGKYAITRKMLTELLAYGFPISILTKSNLVLRDLDLLKQFAPADCEVGFSIATLDEEVRKRFEPGAPPVAHRIEALKKLHKEKIRTWVFIAPILPYLTKSTLSDLLNKIKEDTDYILMDKLNIKCGNWIGISKVLGTYHPALLPKWKDTLFTKEKRIGYYQHIYETIQEFCIKNCLEIRFDEIG